MKSADYLSVIQRAKYRRKRREAVRDPVRADDPFGPRTISDEVHDDRPHLGQSHALPTRYPPTERNGRAQV